MFRVEGSQRIDVLCNWTCLATATDTSVGKTYESKTLDGNIVEEEDGGGGEGDGT